MSGTRSRGVGPACAVAAVAALAAVATGHALGEDTAGGWQLAARYTARIAFPVFLAAFVAGPWQRLRPGPVPRWLLRHRRAIGLAFATIFLAHTVSLVAFNVVNPHNRFVAMVGEFLYRITEPALAPIRRYLPSLGGLDLSPVVLILLLVFLRNLLFEYWPR